MVDNYITDKHRLFIINGKLEFALFCEPSDTKESIETEFLNSSYWKDYRRVYEVKKVTSFKVSKDLKKIQIRAK